MALAPLAAALAAGCRSPAGPTPPLAALDDDRYQVVVALAELAFAGSTMIITPHEIAARADRFLAELDRSASSRLIQALDILNRFVPAIYGRPRRFVQLSPAERARIVGKIQRSRGVMRDLARVIKLVTVFPYYTHPDVRRHIGYVPFEERPRAHGLDLTPLRLAPRRCS